MLMNTITSTASPRGRGDASRVGSTCSIRGSRGGLAAGLLA
jgi:hypothetical protein